MAHMVLRRVVRRELHSPRTVATVLALAVVALAAAYLGIEIVLHLLGAAPLLVAPGAALAWAAMPPDLGSRDPAIVVGAVIVLLGIVLVWLALSPGRRPKHQLSGNSHAVVVDNGVVAAAVAERVRRQLDLAKGAVVVGIGHRSADVTIRPEPGQSVAKDQVAAAAETELADYELLPRVKVRARVLHTSDVKEGP